MGLAIGTRLGPYEIVAALGAGGMGEVYKATDTNLCRQVAIKILPDAFAQDPDRVVRFEREAKTLASLNHPNIAIIHGLERSQGTYALVMELVEGEDLSQRIARGPIPVDEALPIAKQIAEALEAAHEQGIIHRDLKPANIKVTPDGVVKVLDFGLAKLAGPAEAGPSVQQGVGAGFSRPDTLSPTITSPAMVTGVGMLIGTAAYMSPEQAQGQPLDARSDVFSFGAVLYEMLSGQRAFPGGSTLGVLNAVVRDEPLPIQAPPWLMAIVKRCLAKQPGERFQGMAEVKLALERAGLGPVGDAAGARPSIAVLPFTNLSADKDNEYFSDGLAEEILNALTQLPGLRVIARTSAFRFRGEQELRRVGAALQVGLVLEGSVRRAGNRIRVSAQLIQVADESQLWSERYDRELRDVFDIQDEIAQAIVEKLKLKLGGKAGQPLVKRYTENPEAHSFYLKGNFHLYRSSSEGIEKGREYLEKAVALEPGYAPAWVQLADYHIKRSVCAVAPPREELPKALEAARKAVAADEALAEGHAVFGVWEAFGGFHWEQALSRLDTALRLNPASPRSRFWHGIVLCGLRRVKESLAEMHHAVELDPLSALFHAYLANLYIWDGQYERAAEHGRQALEIDAEYGMGMAALGEAYSHLGRLEEGIAILERARQALPGDFWPTAFLGCAYVRAGRQSDVERLLAELEEKRRRRYVSSATVAVVAAAAGETDGCFGYLETAVRERDPNLTHLAPSPQLQALRADPRYQDILARMNLTD